MLGIFDCRWQHPAAADAAVGGAIGGSLGDKNLATRQLPESAPLYRGFGNIPTRLLAYLGPGDKLMDI